jgi:ATP-dependent helicase/DNAse subunit B
MGGARLFLAPAAAGKTAYVLSVVRNVGRGLGTTPRVVVPTQLQVRSWRRRLAEGGGAIGVHVQTFDDLYRACLNAAGEVYTHLNEASQYHLLRVVVNTLGLRHYAPLADRTGFMRLLRQLIGELKAGLIFPETLAEGVAAMGNPLRLVELVRIYEAYQARLQEEKWADDAGLGWLAADALERRALDLGKEWGLLVVDGFDNLTSVQLALLRILADRVGTMIVTLTGQIDGGDQRLVHRRFQEARARLEAALGVQGEPLPETSCFHTRALIHVESGLFSSGASAIDGNGAVEMIAAPDRLGEVRAALRWLKARLITDGMRPSEVALLARTLEPYQGWIEQIAAEFQLPVRLMIGRPLQGNPAVAALLALLRLVLPQSAESDEFALPRRGIVEAWRSPYFDWSLEHDNETVGASAIDAEDADALEAVARWGRVVGGLAQWEEVLDDLVDLTAEWDSEDDERGSPLGLPIGQAARSLRSKFNRFLRLLEPPAGVQSTRRFVAWLEDLIGTDGNGEDGALWDETGGTRDGSGGLRMVAQISRGAKESAERDLAALDALKDVLRGLVWAEGVLGSRRADYAGFYRELTGAVEASTYQLWPDPEREEILVADVLQARGIALRAAAILGLAEGEFPTRLREDPLLRDADRRQLRKDPRLQLE